MNDDMLLQRLIDRRASTVDWDEFDARRAIEPSMTEAFLAGLREDDRLREAFAPVAERAATIDLPHAGAPRPIARWRQPFVHGFAAALLVGILLWIFVPRSPSPGSSLENATPQALLASYVERGRATGLILDELPHVPLRVQPASTGSDKLQVVYVRRFLETSDLDQTVQLASDEHGMPVALPADARSARDI